ncbi:hypothetical protein OAT18_01425 [Tenacibaculum sp.]|nr:hypothetical protein [Tenacibaculum sp.]
MKIYSWLMFLVISITIIGCKKSKSKTYINTTQTQINKQNALSTSASLRSETITTQEHYDYYFVSAKSGLNYRILPNDRIIGKFPLNTQLKVIKKTGVLDTIIDNKKRIIGEWLGIEKENDTVYVFSGFLSSSFTYSNLKIYYTSPYQKSKNETRKSFVNMSENYKWNYETDTPTILYKSELKKDTIQLDDKRKNIFLKKLYLSKSDTIFIYNLHSDSVYKFKVKDIPIVACVNIYALGNENLLEHDYEIGFNLEKKYAIDGENFTYIGKKNPFQTGNIKAIIWKKTNKILPLSNNLNKEKNEQSFYFTTNNLSYYIQNTSLHSDHIDSRYLTVFDKDSVIYKNHYYQSEGIYLTPLNNKNENSRYELQWTGAVFKGKPPILFGFVSHSFGCSTINFINQSEPPIILLCDNRH